MGRKKWAYPLKISLIGITANLSISHVSYADGSLPPCNGINNCGLGGAGLAQPLDPSGGNLNPALLVRLQNALSFSAGIVHQDQKVDTSHAHLTAETPLPPQPRPLKNKFSNFLAALGGINYHLNPNWSIGASTTGCDGPVKYKSSPISPVLKTSTKFVSQAVILPFSLSWQPAAQQSYGISFILAGASLRTNEALPNGKETKGHYKRNNVLGVGARIGGLWDVSSLLSLGTAVSTPVIFQKFRKYHDLIKYRPALPMTIGAGTSWHICPNIDILADFTEYLWREIKITGRPTRKRGQGWKNSYALMFGVNSRLTEEWTTRIGYAFNSVPIPRSEVFFSAFNTANAVIKNTVTAGVSYKISPALSFDVNGLYGLKNKIRDNGKGFLNGLAKGMTISGSQASVLLGITWNY